MLAETVVVIFLVAVAVLVLAYLAWAAYDRRRAAAIYRRRDMSYARLQREVIDRQAATLADPGASVQDVLASIQQLPGLPAPSEPAPPAQPIRNALDAALQFPGADGSLAQIGYRIFKWLLFLAVALLAMLLLYAWQTYPEIVDVPPGSTDPLVALERLRNDWLQQVKDLGQLFILTPVFPLLGAVIGYVFGVRGANRGAPAPGSPPGSAPAQ